MTLPTGVHARPNERFWFSIVEVRQPGEWPAVRDIQQAVCEEFGITLGDMLSPRRPPTLVWPRHVAMYLAKNLRRLSLPALGRHFDRDHTGIIHAVRRVADRMIVDDAFRVRVDGLQRRLEESR